MLEVQSIGMELVFKAAGSNALIHEGTGYTDREAHDYKSTDCKLLAGNNTGERRCTRLRV